MKVISLIHQKGGCGKTTISINLAENLSYRGYKVLLIDTDVQSSALSWNFMRQKRQTEENKKVDNDNLTLVGYPKGLLHKEIKRLSTGYDYVLIDGVHGVTEFTQSLLVASDLVIIPVMPSALDIWSLENILKEIARVKVYKNDIQTYFLTNRANGRSEMTNVVKNTYEELKKIFECDYFKNSFGQRVAYATSLTNGFSVREYKKNKTAIDEVNAVVDEILNVEKDEKDNK